MVAGAVDWCLSHCATPHARMPARRRARVVEEDQNCSRGKRGEQPLPDGPPLVPRQHVQPAPQEQMEDAVTVADVATVAVWRIGELGNGMPAISRL